MYIVEVFVSTRIVGKHIHSNEYTDFMIKCIFSEILFEKSLKIA